MCGGGPDVDTTIQDQMLADSRRAREEEEARKERIRQGTARIEDVFGGFDDSFYGNYRTDILDFYQPQLDDQFSDARDELTFALTRAGTLNSSMAGDKLADLTTAYDTNRAKLLADAEGQVSDLQSRVANEKSSLISLLNSTGDADRAANEALARSQVLFEKQPDYNMLPDIFAGATAGIGGWMERRRQQQMLDTYFGGRGQQDRSRIVGQ